MKLIIDIDDEMYDFTINARKARTYRAEHYVDLILNGKPLEEELEKIKAEIGEEFVDLQDGSEEWRSYVNDAILSCYEIVDKHISELKENKKGVLESIAEEQKTLLDTTKAWSNYIDKNGNIY